MDVFIELDSIVNSCSINCFVLFYREFVWLTAPVAEQPERKKRQFKRSCMKKVHSALELEKKAFGHWLAEQGLTYNEFLLRHHKVAPLKKASVCPLGGFVSLKDMLLKKEAFNTDLECKGCRLLLEEIPITKEDVEKFSDQFRMPDDDEVIRKQSLQGTGGDETIGTARKKKRAKKNKTDNEKDVTQEEEYEKCISYVKQYEPEIELMEGAGNGLSYICRICLSREHPHGKPHYLAVSKKAAKFNSVKFFMDQHVNCATHLKNLARTRQNEEKQTKGSDTESQLTNCPGLMISSTNSEPTGGLGLYEAEFRLWASYGRVDSDTTRHSYWCDLASNKWHCRHSRCSGKPFRGGPCSQCLSMADSNGIRRQVVRFATKWYAAFLLSKRLFYSDKEAQQYEASISQTMFGQRVSTWTQITQLSNAELQQFVRKSWRMKPSEISDKIKDFLGFVITPCLNVHVTSIDCRMQSMFSQFAAAIDKNELSESCLLLFCDFINLIF